MLNEMKKIKIKIKKNCILELVLIIDKAFKLFAIH